MELWTGVLSWWKCHWADLKSAGLFLNSLKTSTLTLTVWPINSGVLTSLLLAHLSSSLTDSLPSLNILCHSKTDAWFMQDGRKAVKSIPYVSVSFFLVEPSVCRSCQCCQKNGSSKVSGWICSVWPSWVWESQHASPGNSVSWSLGHSSRSSFHRMAFFPSLKQNFIAYRSSSVSSRPDCIFEIPQQRQSGFSRVYSNCCCSCSFEPEDV